MAQSAVKNPSAMREVQVHSLGRGDPLENGLATHSSILAWRIPRTEEPVGYGPWDHKELDMTEATEHAHTAPKESFLEQCLKRRS